MKKILLLVLLFASFIFASNYPVYIRENAPIRKDFTVFVGETVNFDIVTYDPDGDSVSINVMSVLPEGVVLGETMLREDFSDSSLPEPTSDSTPAWYTKNFTWTPNYQQAGEYVIEIQAVDEFGAENWVQYKVIVIGVNRPPVL